MALGNLYTEAVKTSAASKRMRQRPWARGQGEGAARARWLPRLPGSLPAGRASQGRCSPLETGTEHVTIEAPGKSVLVVFFFLFFSRRCCRSAAPPLARFHLLLISDGRFLFVFSFFFLLTGHPQHTPSTVPEVPTAALPIAGSGGPASLPRRAPDITPLRKGAAGQSGHPLSFPRETPHKSQSLHCRATKPAGSAYEFKFGEGKRALTQHAPCSREQPGRGNEWWKLKSLSLRSAPQRVPLAALAVRRGLPPPRRPSNASLDGQSSARPRVQPCPFPGTALPVPGSPRLGCRATHDARSSPQPGLRWVCALRGRDRGGAEMSLWGDAALCCPPLQGDGGGRMGAADTAAGFLLPK